MIASYPHDIHAFTQGLAFDGDSLIESTGGYGKSELRRVAWRTGEVLHRQELPPRYFGEGATVFHGEILQLTWRAGRVLRWSRDFTLRETLRYHGQGWGIAHDDTHLYMSNGTDQVEVRDPGGFDVVRTFAVRDGMRPVHRLNELEVSDSVLYANIWYSDRIARIDPDSGRVTGWLNLAALRDRFDPPPGWNARENVLNGIARHPGTGHLFVTGKRWPRMFELKILDPSGPPANAPD